MPKVVRTGEPELFADVTDEMLVAAAAGDDRLLEILRRVGYRSVIIVPLSVGGKAIGAATMVRSESGERYDTKSLAFAPRLAVKMASAIRTLSSMVSSRTHGRSAERRLRRCSSG